MTLDPKAASLAYTTGNDNEVEPSRLMLCSYCAKGIGEIKTMGGFSPCASCGIPEHVSGPVTVEQVVQARAFLERMASLGEALEEAGLADAIREGMEADGYVKPGSVAASGQAPAGVVRIPGEELLEAVESEEDIVNANRELLEGTPQTERELDQWRRLYRQMMDGANQRLRGRGVMLLVAVPNPNGLGAVFTGVDLARFEAARNSGLMTPGGEDYEVVLTLPARERVDLRRTQREEFVRKFIGVICDAVLEQQAAYRAKQGMH